MKIFLLIFTALKQAYEKAKNNKETFSDIHELESIVINELNRMSREFLDMDETAQKICACQKPHKTRAFGVSVLYILLDKNKNGINYTIIY